MIERAVVALFADHILLTEALSSVTVAVFHAALVAHAAPAILSLHGVAEEAWRAQVTRLAVGVVQALQAVAGDRIARANLIGVDIARTFARLAVIVVHLRFAVVAGRAGFATGAVVTGQAIAANLIALVIHFAAGGEVVGSERQWTRANQTVRRRAHGSVAVVALLAQLAVVAGGAVLAVLRNIGGSHKKL